MTFDNLPLPDLKTQEFSRAFGIFRGGFTKHLATVISLTEKIPDQAGNHIRNAFTHLARADSLSDRREIEKEVEKAINHIERASRDCLKISIIFLHDRLKSMVADARAFYGRTTPSINTGMREIREAREKVCRDEAENASDVASDYEIIVLRGINLENEINAAYNEHFTWNKRQFSHFIMRWSSPISYVAAIAIGFALRSIADDLFDYLKPLLDRLW